MAGWQAVYVNNMSGRWNICIQFIKQVLKIWVMDIGSRLHMQQNGGNNGTFVPEYTQQGD